MVLTPGYPCSVTLRIDEFPVHVSVTASEAGSSHPGVVRLPVDLYLQLAPESEQIILKAIGAELHSRASWQQDDWENADLTGAFVTRKITLYS